MSWWCNFWWQYMFSRICVCTCPTILETFQFDISIRISSFVLCMTCLCILSISVFLPSSIIIHTFHSHQHTRCVIFAIVLTYNNHRIIAKEFIKLKRLSFVELIFCQYDSTISNDYPRWFTIWSSLLRFWLPAVPLCALRRKRCKILAGKHLCCRLRPKLFCLGRNYSSDHYSWHFVEWSDMWF